MSTDSSRDATMCSEKTAPKVDETSTPKPSSKGAGAVHIALQSTLDQGRLQGAAMTMPPTSGRPHVARLPVVEKEVYRIEGEVAQGGIGRVLSARDERLDRRVAVKVLLEESGAYEDRFVREALVTARLQHPSIVPVYEAGRWPTGEPFYSMKLVSGKPLLEVIEQSRSLDERLPLLTRVLAIADAMAYAHERKIIHRDLKPANILVGAHGETVLIDWGLAKDLQEAHIPSAAEMIADPNTPAPESNTLTMVGSVMGTPAYMPPEQAAGETVDERADVYALGAILYHVLSGKQPYAGYDGMQTIMRVLEEAPKALETLQSGIPRDLQAIIDKAMHRDRDLRYPTAKEFAEDLRRFLNGQFVGAHQYSSRERALRFVRRHRTAFGVGAVAVVLMVINGALYVSRIVRERDRAEAERRRAEIAREQATKAQEESTIRADELTLVEARAAVERDPNAALAWLKVLSPAFQEWNAVRIIAADAWSRGTSMKWQLHKEVINALVFFPDERRFVTVSDDRTIRIVDIESNSSRVIEGHTDEVWSIGMTADGKRIATGSKDTKIRLWDVATGQTTQVLEGHKAGIVYTVFSRDEKHLFSQSDDCTLRIWDLESGQSRVLASGVKVALKSIIGPDETNFVSAGLDGSVWHVGVDGTEPKRFPGLIVNSDVVQVGGKYPMVFSPDGQTLAVGSKDGLVHLVDLQTEKQSVLEGQTRPIVRVTYSPDGHSLAAASGDGTLRVWDLAQGTSRALPAQEANVSSLVFSPNGRMLAAAGYDKAVRVIDLSTGARRRFIGMQDIVYELRFFKDNSRLAVTSGEGAVRVFQLHRDAGRLLGRHDGPALSMDISPRGDYAVSAGGDGLVRVWPLGQTNEAPMAFAGHVGTVQFVQFSPNGELIASSGVDGTVRLWDRQGHQIRALSADELWASQIAFSPDGKNIALANTKGLVRLWDVDSGALRELGRHAAHIIHVSFSPDGRKLGTAGADRIANVWDVESGTVTPLRGHDDAVSWIAFSPDNRTTATGGLDHRLRLWDPGASEPRVIDASGYKIQGLTFLPNGASLLGYNGGSSVRLFEVQSGKTIRQFRGHRGNITSLALSEDGTMLATGSDDRTVRLYDIETGESRVMGVHEAAVQAVGIDPHGKWALSVGDDGAVRMWSDDLPREPEALRKWIASAVTDVIDVDALREGSIPLP